MDCFKCGNKTKISNTRQFIDENGYPNTSRRHICNKCGYRFSTLETVIVTSVRKSRNTYTFCFNSGEYDNQDCTKCPHLSECGGFE